MLNDWINKYNEMKLKFNIVVFTKYYTNLKYKLR